MSNKIIYHIYRRSTAAPAEVCEHKHCSKFQIDIMMELDIYLEKKNNILELHLLPDRGLNSRPSEPTLLAVH